MHIIDSIRSMLTIGLTIIVIFVFAIFLISLLSAFFSAGRNR